MHEVSPPDDNWIRFYEYKSYKNPAEIDIEQFKNYIGSITNLKQLRYVFEESKLIASGISAKDGMKAFLKSKEIDVISAMTPSVKVELGIAPDATELTNNQIQKIVDTIVESK